MFISNNSFKNTPQGVVWEIQNIGKIQVPCTQVCVCFFWTAFSFVLTEFRFLEPVVGCLFI